MQKFPMTWDDEAKAGYLYLCNTEEKVARTVELEDTRFLLDLSELGGPIGIEFLSDVPVSALMAQVKKYGF